MNAEAILHKARLTLSDTGKSRWSDARLLSALNDALADIALTTRVFSASGYLELEDNISIYDVSDFAIKIERVEYLNLPLQMLSFSEMDRRYGRDLQHSNSESRYYNSDLRDTRFDTRRGGDWQETTSDTPLAIVYDLHRSAEFTVYPVPVLYKNVDDYPVASNPEQYDGIITDMYYSGEIEIISDEDFGGISEPKIKNYLRLYYTKTPKNLEVIHSDDYASAAEIEHSMEKLLREPLDDVIDRTMLSILAHYVAGKAFRDNMDTTNVKLGNEELMLYHTGKRMLANEKMKGNVERSRTSTYNPLG